MAIERGPGVQALAEAAGLSLALAQFPEDVVAAAESARTATAGLTLPADRVAEPWPPMRTGFPA